MSEISENEKYRLKKLLKQLSQYKGRHTELVSVYIPAGYDINKVIQQIFEEKGTASNIKSTGTRKNVEGALDKMLNQLRLLKFNPPNGVALFAGNVSEKEGKDDFQSWWIEPPAPLNIRIYKCDKTFELGPLEQYLETKEVYGMVVMDRREATIALLKGKAIIILDKTSSNVPGKTKAGGQCVIPESIVQLADGSLLEIKDLHNPLIVKSVDLFRNEIIDSNITEKWNSKKSVYKITTKYPRLELESSGDHSFFVWTEKGIIEKTAGNLSENDFLIMPEKIDIKGKVQSIKSKKYYNSFVLNSDGIKFIKKKRESLGLDQWQLAKKVNLTQTAISVFELGKRNPKRETLANLCGALGINYENFLEKYTNPFLYREIKLPKRVDGNFARFLGYFLGDGSFETDRITFFEQNKEVATEYKNRYDKYFSLNSSYKFREDKNYHQVKFTSRPLVRLIKEEFSELKKARDSEIPRKILKSSNKILASFLRGLFDAEGYVNVGRGVGISMNNKKLIQQVQLALLRFSIISSFNEYDNRRNPYSKNPRYTLDITEEQSLRLFKSNIGFTFNLKMKKLDSTINLKKGKSSVRQIIIPGTEIRKIVNNAGYNLQIFPKVNNFFRNERMIGKMVFQKSIIDFVKDKNLKRTLRDIYNIPILPVKIGNIQKTNKKIRMVDISVKNQNFIANGIIVHNSAVRFAQLRENATVDFFKKIAEMMKKHYLPLVEQKKLKGIILGGPGHTKYEFKDKDYITDQVNKKIISVKDVSYTDEFGIQELLEKSEDVLAQESVAEEKKIVGDFFFKLASNQKIVVYGINQVREAIELGAVDMLLLSETLDDNVIEEFQELAKKYGTKVMIVSQETREGVQLRDIGKIGAILRYAI